MPPLVTLEPPSLRRQADFLDAVRRSRRLHGGWVEAPKTAAEYRSFLRLAKRPTRVTHFVCTRTGDLVGVINISEIVRGAFQSGYLGYYAFTRHAGRGYMREGLRRVIHLAFRRYKLHRVEANIQPGNSRSIALVRSLGFRLEGRSARYLKIGGRWRDHERWALTVEDWKGRGRHMASNRSR